MVYALLHAGSPRECIGLIDRCYEHRRAGHAGLRAAAKVLHCVDVIVSVDVHNAPH
ncbi:hypothetical protein ACVXHB_28880 [Escherichia coli]